MFHHHTLIAFGGLKGRKVKTENEKKTQQFGAKYFDVVSCVRFYDYSGHVLRTINETKTYIVPERT